MRRRLLVLPVVATLLLGVGAPVGAETGPVTTDPVTTGPENELVVIGQPTLSEPHIDFVGEPTGADIQDALDSIATIAAEDVSRPRGAENTVPEGAQFAASGDDFTVDYRTTDMPNEVKLVVNAVMTEWANVLDMNGAGVQVEIFYQPIAGGTLAATASFSVPVTEGGETFNMPTAVLNARNGSDEYPYDSDLQVYINSNETWNYQTTGPIRAYEYHLYTTMLHEIGHGLGFWGDIDPQTTASDTPSSFDVRIYHDLATSAEDGPATPVRTSQNPVTATGHSWFKNLDGTWERIHDPSSGFQGGSSMSHFDEYAYRRFLFDAGALMTPVQSSGELIYTVDNVTLGVMEAVGWKVKRPPLTPEVSSATVSPVSVDVVLVPNTQVEGPPAVQWEVLVKSGTETVGSIQVAATQRSISVPVFLPAGDYEVVVLARGSGGSSAPTSTPILSTNVTPPAYDNCRQAPVNPTFATEDATKASLFRLYCSYFLRNPDPDGFGYWYQTFSSGAVGLNEISNLFATSKEFGLTYGSLSNEAFINLVYRNVMERQAEPEGFRYWLGKIEQGVLTRGEVMFYFSQSEEFQIKTGTF